MNSVKDALKLSLVIHIILSSVYMSAGNYASAEQNEAVYISSSGSIREASISQVIDGEDGFWAPSSGGTGSIEISVGVSTGTYYSAPSSLSYQVVSGAKGWVNIQHTWVSAQDWGGYDDLAFYWYGRASGASLTVNLEASSWTNRFSGSFVDDFTGWRKVTLPLGGFTSVGAPSWSSVKKIIVGYAGD